MSSFTLTLSGDNSELTANYHPPIELDRDGEYVCGLAHFQSFMSFSNIHSQNNKLFYERVTACQMPKLGIIDPKYINMNTWKITGSTSEVLKAVAKSMDISYILNSQKEFELSDIISVEGEFSSNTVHIKHLAHIAIPIGTYEFDEIATYLSREMPKVEKNAYLFLRSNKNTLKSELKANLSIVFDSKRSTLGTLLGFRDGTLAANTDYISDNIIKITSTNVIRLETNITSGAYSNNRLMRTLHEFYPAVERGYKISEVPRNIIYLPVSNRSIHNFTVRIVDQDGNLIDFQGETITLRVHIKRI